jgi:hypothetical protein
VATRACVKIAMVLASLLAAGCSNNSAPKPAVPVDNTFPADYKNQIASFLSTVLIDRADYANSLIGTPTLVQVGDAPHYIVCVQFNGHNQHRDKVAIYLGQSVTQFVDAQPGQCANANYQPFRELAAMVPGR